jgi:hypothetical protein
VDLVAPVVRARLAGAGEFALAEHLVDHQVEQFLLGRHVGVERHRADAEFLGDAVHRGGGQALLVGQRDTGVDHRVQVEPRPPSERGFVRLRLLAMVAPQQRESPVRRTATAVLHRHVATFS